MRQVILHPILFAVYPAIFLYSANWQVFDATIVLVPCAIALLVTLALWAVLHRVCRDAKESALFTSALILTFFSYRAVDEFVRGMIHNSAPQNVGSKVIFFSFLIVIVFACGWFKLRRYAGPLTYIVNIVGTVLVFVPMAEICVRSVETMSARDLLPARPPLEVSADAGQARESLPDIYYMVLDAYGRSDFLRDQYGFDNSDLIAFLKEKGFYVAERSTTNYPITLVSISSTLNSMYWDELGARLGQFKDRRFLREMMQQSRVVGALKSAGYRIVAFDGEYSEAGIAGADIVVKEWWFPNSFEVAWIQMTPVPAILEALGQSALYDLHRERVVYPLEHLPEVARLAGPKFVYFHTFFGHPPFVFGPKGERVALSADYSWDDGDKFVAGSSEARESYVNGYRSQVTFLNSKLKTAIEQILAQSERKPIIIVQGDHGPGSRFSLTSLEQTDVRERYSILNALLLPEEGRSQLYDTISPVNTFRVVLNTCLKAGHPLLEDKSYYNPFLEPYHYFPVDESRKLMASQPLGDEAREEALAAGR